MPKLVTIRVAFPRRCSVLTLAVILPMMGSAVPARAQAFFGFFQPFSPPAAQAPAYTPLEFQFVPALEQPMPRPRVRPRAKVAHVAQPPLKMPEKAKPEGEVANPVPSLLADSTLRPGDMVMFPNGLRVFTGEPGTKHVLADFEPASQAGKAVTFSTRKLVAQLRPGANAAWSVDAVRSGGKLAVNSKDVATTGSVRRNGR